MKSKCEALCLRSEREFIKKLSHSYWGKTPTPHFVTRWQHRVTPPPPQCWSCTVPANILWVGTIVCQPVVYCRTVTSILTSEHSSAFCTKNASPASPSFMCRSTGSPLTSMSTCNRYTWWQCYIQYQDANLIKGIPCFWNHRFSNNFSE